MSDIENLINLNDLACGSYEIESYIRSSKNTIDRLTAELDELKRIVDRLPKTRDGVRVVPGDDRVFHTVRNDVKRMEVVQGFTTSDAAYITAFCWSTREAAQAALAARENGGSDE